MYFHLQQLQLVEMLRADRTDDALAFATDVLAPLGEEQPLLLDALEQTMSLFLLDMQVPDVPRYAAHLYRIDRRTEVASELNAAILSSQGHPPMAQLERLLHLQELADPLLLAHTPPVLPAPFPLEARLASCL